MSLLHFTAIAGSNSPASMTVSLSSNCSVVGNTPMLSHCPSATLEDHSAAVNVSSSTGSHKCSRSSSRGVAASAQPNVTRSGAAKLVPLSIREVRSASTSPISESAAYVSPSRHFPIPLVSTPNKRTAPTSFVVKPHPMLPPDQVRALQCGSPSASLFPRGSQREASTPHIATPIARLGGFSRQTASAPLAQGPTFRPSRDGARAAHSYRVPAYTNTANFTAVPPSLQEHATL